MAALAQTASQKPEAEAPSFKVQRSEVIVPVTVTDYKGRLISNLTRSDFKVFEDGREQKIEFFSRQANQPIVLGLVLDLSSGSRVHWENFQKTAEEMVWALLSDDKDKKYSGFLVTFSTAGQSTARTVTCGDWCASAIPHTPEPAPISSMLDISRPPSRRCVSRNTARAAA